jgi:hypothetical protein
MEIIKYSQTKQDDDLTRFVMRMVSQVSWTGMLRKVMILSSLLWLPHCFAKFLEKMQLSV